MLEPWLVVCLSNTGFCFGTSFVFDRLDVFFECLLKELNTPKSYLEYLVADGDVNGGLPFRILSEEGRMSGEEKP